MDMLTTVEKAALLIEVDLFQDVPSDVLAELAAQMEETAHEPGDLLNVPEDAEPRLHVVVDGQVRLARPGAAPVDLGRGAAFGLLPVLGLARSETATVIEPCRLLSIPPDEYLDALADSSALAIANLRALGRRVQEMDGRVTAPVSAPAAGAGTR